MAPLERRLEVSFPPAAATERTETVVGEVPFAGRIESLHVIFDAAVDGVADAWDDFRGWALVNRGQEGAGEDAITSFDSPGQHFPAYDAVEMPLQAGGLPVAPGDVLTWVSTGVGAGFADPGGRIVVVIARS